MSYIVKNVLLNNIQGCADVFCSVFAMPPWYEIWKKEDAYQRLYEIYSTKNSISLCCIIDDKVVGCLFGVLYKWYNGYQFEIKEFFVNKKNQGKGIGKAILDHLELLLSDKKPVEMFLQTLSHEDTIFFYKSRGYAIKEKHLIFGKKFN
jgi:aminoglycoside 6'-N-acetyltransferase I